LLNGRARARYDQHSYVPALIADKEVTPDMGGGSEPKKQLGKIMLQQRVISAEELAEQRAAAAARREPATDPTRAVRAPVLEALAQLGQQHGRPTVDLAERIIPLAALKLVPIEMARERVIVPFAVDGERLWIAFGAPPDAELLEELSFVAGKAIEPYLCLEPMVRAVVEQAYELLPRGDTQMYVGAFVTPSQLAAAGLPADLPRAPDPMPPPERQTPAPAEAAQAAPARPKPMPSEPPELDTAFGSRTRPSVMPPMLAPDSEARVMLACSDAALRELLRGALAELGLTVIDADSGVRALELARDQELKVIVIDADLDQMHGFEVWRRMRSTALFAKTAVIMITGGPRQWRVREDLRETLGVSHCHARPVDPKRLARTVRLLLDDPNAPPELPPLSAEAEALWNNAMQAFQAGDLDRAIATLEGGLARDPDAFELRYHLGLLYGRRDNAFAAIRSLELAVALQPHHFSALKNLAVVYQRAGFTKASVDVWQQAMAAAPDEETRATIREHMLSLL
jgi:DNA-binding response OmpR family regulator